MTSPLSQAALEQLFTQARSRNAWRKETLPDSTWRDLYDVLKFGPTSANLSPARFAFVTTPEGKARLAPHLSESNRAKSRFVWSYTVEIENRSLREIQLISRHWIITDALNRTEEVRGPGVVGEQPSLKPGEAYRYASACPLATSSGMMGGAYQMLSTEGDLFDVEIPTFSLHLPGAGLKPN